MSKENLNMFEEATRKKLRFNTRAGDLDVEYLWDLPLTNSHVSLDELAMRYKQELDSKTVKSFVNPDNEVNEIVELKFKIVKHIIDVKLAECADAERAANKRAKKQRLLELIAAKEDQETADLGIEELKKMVEEL